MLECCGLVYVLLFLWPRKVAEFASDRLRKVDCPTMLIFNVGKHSVYPLDFSVYPKYNKQQKFIYMSLLVLQLLGMVIYPYYNGVDLKILLVLGMRIHPVQHRSASTLATGRNGTAG